MGPHPSNTCGDTWTYCPKMAKRGDCITGKGMREKCCLSCKDVAEETEEEKEKRLCADSEYCKDYIREAGGVVNNCKEYGQKCKRTCGLCKNQTPHPSNYCA